MSGLAEKAHTQFRQIMPAMREKCDLLNRERFLPEYQAKLDRIFAAATQLLDVICRRDRNVSAVDAWERAHRDAKKSPGREQAHWALIVRADDELPKLKTLQKGLDIELGLAIATLLEVAPLLFSFPFTGHFDFCIPVLAELFSPKQLEALAAKCPHVKWPQSVATPAAVLDEHANSEKVLALSAAVFASIERSKLLLPDASQQDREAAIDDILDHMIPLLKLPEGRAWMGLLDAVKPSLALAQRQRLSAEFPDLSLN